MEHERRDALSTETLDFHRALESLKEEIEAVDWYQQRATMAGDPELRRILEHNRNEEIEHACMILEWLRRNMAKWDEHMKTYLFTNAPIVEVEADATGRSPEGSPAAGRAARSIGLKITAPKEG